ncbi:uroporphyrinogen-III synthase [Sphingomonas lutea]|uniref:Uroporphyrinogen-III synthase n=1 Tax=Sphingomonas lutea TaxID=1045317 RepID=A0A7G9SIF8_9SPHN|nr:uroporphyrinogen-III synthase [Sphingomonas lutea]QNN67633.1 uroporphyrinogen-III synthase [Sphingomonas lutea]
MTRVLVLRPEPAASTTVARARQLGLDADAVPLFEIEPVAWNAPEATVFDGLLVTSANAVRHGGEALQAVRSLPVYAVGGATAAAARDAGFDIASIGSAGVDDLLDSVSPDLRLLHLAGADRKPPTESRQRITPVTVYRSCPREVALGEVAGAVALIHSPRAGRRFAELVEDRRTVTLAAISPAAADAAGAGWCKVAAAETPSDEALLALAAQLCKTLRPS